MLGGGSGASNNRSLPFVQGLPVMVGTKLIGWPGVWKNVTGSFSYEWLLDGVPVVGATNNTYVSVPSDAGKSLSLRVSVPTADGVQTATSTGRTVASNPGALSALTQDFTRNENPSAWDWQPVNVQRSGRRGVVYEVGPGKTYADFSTVPWLSLVGGDRVLVYWQATPYVHGAFVGERGTASEYITIEGVPDPNTGARPVFTGIDAILPGDTGVNQYTDGTAMIYISKPVGAVSTGGNYRPGFLWFTGMRFENVNHAHSYHSNYSGTTQAWGYLVCGIAGTGMDNVMVSNCEFDTCGTGIFFNSGGDGAMSSNFFTIRANYFRNCGAAGRASEHNAYTEGLGSIYEYNYFDSPVSGTGGDNIKERSAGNVFRHNFIRNGVNLISFRDPQSNAGWERDALDNQGANMCRKIFVYGNVFLVDEINIYGDSNIFMSMGDGPFGIVTPGLTQLREGDVYSYGNKFISKQALSAGGGSVPVFDPINTRAPMTFHTYNNQFVALNASGGTTSAAPIALCYYSMTADWTTNWVNAYQLRWTDTADGGLASGTMFTGTGLGGLTAAGAAADPGFTNAAAGDYSSTVGSPYLTLNASDPTDVTSRGLSMTVGARAPSFPFEFQ